MKRLISQQSGLTITLAEICKRLPISWFPAFSRFWGSILYLTQRKARRQILKGYERLCERAGLADDPRVLTREHFRIHLFMMVAHYVFENKSDEVWEQFVSVEGREYIDECFKAGVGAVYCSLHFCSHLILMSNMFRCNHPSTTIRPPYMEGFRNSRVRKMLTIDERTIFLGESRGLASPLKTAVQFLKDKYAIGIAIDGDQGGDEIMAPLFGGEMPVHPGALDLARITGAPVLFALVRIEKWKLILSYSPPLWLPRDKEEAQPLIDEFFRKSFKWYEETIRRAPACVHWTKPFIAGLGLKRKDRPSEE